MRYVWFFPNFYFLKSMFLKCRGLFSPLLCLIISPIRYPF